MDRRNYRIQRAVHWFFSLFVVAMLTMGFYMTRSDYSLETYQLHKSLGVIFLFTIWVRVLLSIKKPWPSSSVGTNKAHLVRAMHSILIALLVIMPVSGFLSSGFSGYSVHLFDFIIIPQNPTSSGDIVPFNDVIYQIAKFVHRISAYALTILVSGHIFAALKHHYIDKDNTLTRMLFGGASKN